MEKELLPVLDMEKLKQKAQESAMNGAMKEIEDFYTSYNSPFRKKIKEELESKQINSHQIQLPEIMGLINDSLSKEIDSVANQAVSKSFIPMVKKFLTRAEKEMKFSEILQDIVNDNSLAKPSEYSCSVEKHREYDWLYVNITADENQYKITLHVDSDSKKEGKERYKILSLPSQYDRREKMMKIKLDGATLEIPFTSDVLQDNFVSLVARLIIAQTIIEMDVDDFDEEMFPEECHC